MCLGVFERVRGCVDDRGTEGRESYTPGGSSYESPILSTTPMSQKHTPTLAIVNVLLEGTMLVYGSMPRSS